MLTLRQHCPGPKLWKGVLVTLGFIGLRADFGFVAGRLHLWALRAGRSSLVLDREGPLWDVPLMMLSMGP